MALFRNTIIRRNWHAYKKEWEIQFKQKWQGNRDCYCNYCGNKCIEYFDICPHGLEESTMCIKCAEQIKNAI